MKKGTGNGRVYQPKGRNGQRTAIWWMQYYVPGERKPMRCSTKTADEAEARRILHARLAECGRMRAARVQQASVTVKDLLDLAVADYQKDGKTVPWGHYAALHHALGHLKAFEDIESTTLDALCEEWRKHGIRIEKDADGVVAEREAYRVRPLAGATLNRHMSFLSLGYTLAKKKLALVHATLCFPSYEEPKNPHPIPPDVLADIFQHLCPPPRANFLRFLVVAGPRKGQVLDTLASQFTSAIGEMRWTDEDTKSGLPHIVTYTGEALDLLNWFVEQRDRSCPYLFQEDGQRLTGDKLDFAWERACRAAHLPIGRRNKGYVIHDLRATFVSDAHDAGLSAGVIMAHTGHVQEPTMYRYLKTSAAAQVVAQEKLDQHRRGQAARVAAARQQLRRIA